MKQILDKISAAISEVFVAAGSPGHEQAFHGYNFGGLMPELDYKLIDENGDAVDADAYAGYIRLLLFGFTHCKDICPANLARLRSALAGLDPEQQEKIRVLFVSVDPNRDTPERLQQYARRFGPQLVGLTGSQAQLKKLTRGYRVTYSYGAPDKQGFYEVSHSSKVFVFGADGRARLLINQEQRAADITEDLQRLLSELE